MSEDMKQLFLDAHTEDTIHDVTFSAGHQRFAAHRVILAHFAKEFYKDICCDPCLVESNNDIEISSVSCEAFRLILEFIYTGTCRLLQPGPPPNNLCASVNSEKPPKNESAAESVKYLQQCCTLLNVKRLAALLDKVSRLNSNWNVPF